MWSCYFADAPVIHAALVPMTRKVCFLTRFEYPGRCPMSSQHRRLRIRIYSDLASHSLMRVRRGSSRSRNRCTAFSIPGLLVLLNSSDSAAIIHALLTPLSPVMDESRMAAFSNGVSRCAQSTAGGFLLVSVWRFAPCGSGIRIPHEPLFQRPRPTPPSVECRC